MAENTHISWTDNTFNPWTGCTKVSPGCANCYAEGWAKRSGIVEWGKGKPRRRTSATNWKDPIRWNKVAGCFPGKPRPRVFCASLADWLDDEVPVEWLADLLDLIRRTPNLDWLLLSKRPENFHRRLQAVLDFIPTTGIDLQWAALRARVQVMLCGWEASSYTALELGIQNYWIGTTVENQEMADKRIPELLKIPAKVRFLSCEPLLEPVFIGYWMAVHRCWKEGMSPPPYPGHWYEPQALVSVGWSNPIHWVICGGESGAGFRPFNPEWARSLRDQCKAAAVAFHMKQMGGLKPSMMPAIPEDLMIREFPTYQPS